MDRFDESEETENRKDLMIRREWREPPDSEVPYPYDED
jgi:hypothetical protein